MRTSADFSRALLAIMSPTLFRSLIVSSVLLAIAAGLLDQYFPPMISQPLAAALEREPASGLLETHPILSFAIFLPWLAAFLASTIGLLFFKCWARSTAFYSTLIGLAIYFFFGPELSSAFASALNDVSSMTWGAVLAL